jgi:hypothetical protein
MHGFGDQLWLGLVMFGIVRALDLWFRSVEGKRLKKFKKKMNL